MNRQRIGLICWAPAAALAVLSCSRTPPLPPAEQTYTIRGLITSLPSPQKPASELLIRHEPVPTFVGRDGRIVGMESMEMPFSPAKGLSLSGLHVGQPVEFTLEVRWTPPARMTLTRIAPLPAGTTLDLGATRQ